MLLYIYAETQNERTSMIENNGNKFNNKEKQKILFYT